MNALVVRRKQDGSLVCFGPAGRMYEPTYDPAQAVVSTEPYEAVVAEWKASQPTSPDRPLAKERVKNARTLPELIAALQDLL